VNETKSSKHITFTQARSGFVLMQNFQIKVFFAIQFETAFQNTSQKRPLQLTL